MLIVVIFCIRRFASKQLTSLCEAFLNHFENSHAQNSQLVARWPSFFPSILIMLQSYWQTRTLKWYSSLAALHLKIMSAILLGKEQTFLD